MINSPQNLPAAPNAPRPLTRVWWRTLSRSRQAAYTFIGIGIAIILVGFVLRALKQAGVDFFLLDFIDQTYSNFGIELVSVGLTVLVIDRLNRDDAERERKEELISQMGSQSNDIARDAVRLLKLKGWLADGSLEGARLWEANLQAADLNWANLQNAELNWINLQHASLHNVNLKNATLTMSNLEGVSLVNADLRGAKLMGAKLRGASLYREQFDETTILPDGKNWTPDRDLREFTDPDVWKASHLRSTPNQSSHN